VTGENRRQEEPVSTNSSRNPWGCYDVRFLALALGVAAVILAAAWLGRGFPRGSGARIAFALVQGGAISVLIVAMMRSLRRLDELQQKIHFEALAFSFAGTGAVVTGYGFLVKAGLPDLDWGAVVWPLMTALWMIGVFHARRRYQ
jgi:hypothetical protein